MPLGTHVVGVGYVYQSGEMYFDPLLQAEDVTLDMHALAGIYVQPVKLGNKLGRIDILLPHATAGWEGWLSAEPTVKRCSGFADPRIRFSMNLIGPNAMGPKEILEYYSEHPVSTMLGVSIAVTFPFGKYDENKLLNIGQNRFIFRPQVGVVHNWGLWSYELTGSIFIFTNNNRFYNNQLKEQKAIFALLSHVIKRFRNKMWASVGGTYGLGGESIVEGLGLNDGYQDLLYSLSVSTPIGKTQAVKLVYMRWETQRSMGSATNSLGVSWMKLF